MQYNEVMEKILWELDIFDKNSPDYEICFNFYEKLREEYISFFWKKYNKKDIENFQKEFINRLKVDDFSPNNKKSLEKLILKYSEELEKNHKKMFYDSISNFCNWVWSILDFWRNIWK